MIRKVKKITECIYEQEVRDALLGAAQCLTWDEERQLSGIVDRTAKIIFKEDGGVQIIQRYENEKES